MDVGPQLTQVLGMNLAQFAWSVYLYRHAKFHGPIGSGQVLFAVTGK